MRHTRVGGSLGSVYVVGDTPRGLVLRVTTRTSGQLVVTWTRPAKGTRHATGVTTARGHQLFVSALRSVEAGDLWRLAPWRSIGARRWGPGRPGSLAPRDGEALHPILLTEGPSRKQP